MLMRTRLTIEMIIFIEIRSLLLKNAGIMDRYMKIDVPNDTYEGFYLPMATVKRTVSTSAKF